MDERLGGPEAGRRSSGADDEHAQGGAAHWETVVRTYLVALLGPERAGSRADRPLVDLAALSDGAGGSAPDGASVRKAAESAGLDALDREVRRIDRRIWRAATGRVQCNSVARRLRGRAHGRISADDLHAFYRHLERCQTCAAIAGRFEAGEWYLQVELGSTTPPITTEPVATPTPTLGPEPAPPSEPEPAPTPIPPAPAPTPSPEPEPAPAPTPIPPSRVPAPPLEPEPTPPPPAATRPPEPEPTPPPAPRPDRQVPVYRLAPDASKAPAESAPTAVPPTPANVPTGSVKPPPVTPTRRPAPAAPAPGFRDGALQVPAPPAPGDKPVLQQAEIAPFGLVGGRSRRRSAAIVVLAIVAAVGAALAVIVVTGVTTANQSTAPTLIRPLQESTTTTSPLGTTPGASIHDAKVPFVVGGARFSLVVDPKDPWTAFTGRIPPARGSRWVLVTVFVRNLSRVDFDPRVLHYRLLVAGGAAYFPDLGRGTGPDLRGPPRPLAVGATAQAELAFQVPNAAAGLQLAFDPTAMHRRVVVALGQ